MQGQWFFLQERNSPKEESVGLTVASIKDLMRKTCIHSATSQVCEKNIHATSATTNAAWQCSSIGTRYAKVFPLPVGATPMMSRPLIAAGHTWQRLGRANGRGKCRIVWWDPTWRFWKQKEWSQVTSQSTWRTYSGKQLKVAKDSLSLDAFLPLIPEESASRCQGGLRFGQKASTKESLPPFVSNLHLWFLLKWSGSHHHTVLMDTSREFLYLGSHRCRKHPFADVPACIWMGVGFSMLKSSTLSLIKDSLSTGAGTWSTSPSLTRTSMLCLVRKIETWFGVQDETVGCGV